jgi:hypothetical protein
MADSGERRMLFDTRGRRRNVIRVVYAVLALLMAGSLFLTVGPFSLSELAGGGSATDAAELAEERAEGVEERLAKTPNDEELLLALTRARINAGNAKAETDPRSGTVTGYPAEAQREFGRAQEAWERYLAQAGDEPNPSAAQLVASTYFGIAERGSSSVAQIQENLETAVKAQRIAAELRPNTGSLSGLAIYEYFNGNFARGDQAAQRLYALATSKAEREGAEKQIAEYRKRAKRYVTQTERISEAERKAGGGASQNPFGFGGETPGAGVPGG